MNNKYISYNFQKQLVEDVLMSILVLLFAYFKIIKLGVIAHGIYFAIWGIFSAVLVYFTFFRNRSFPNLKWVLYLTRVAMISTVFFLILLTGMLAFHGDVTFPLLLVFVSMLVSHTFSYLLLAQLSAGIKDQKDFKIADFRQELIIITGFFLLTKLIYLFA